MIRRILVKRLELLWAGLGLLGLAAGCGGNEFTATPDQGSAVAAADGGDGSVSGAGRSFGGSSDPNAAGSPSLAVGGALGGGGFIESGGAAGQVTDEANGGAAVAAAGSVENAAAGASTVSECPCAPPTPSCIAGKCVARGPTLVKTGSYYIDATEVTVAQYAAFLAAKGADVSGQAPECSWNDSFQPAIANQPPTHPITSVDFCDAAAFCAWANKRMCGKIGGGMLALNDVPVASKSEWFAACGGPKGQPFPYGSSHVDGACNDVTGAGSVAPAGAFPHCTGVYSGLFDMVGNVAEWIDACDAQHDGWDGCETIGGSFSDNLQCSGSGLRHRDQREASVGFRCCSDG